jgi:hypothetical protein
VLIGCPIPFPLNEKRSRIANHSGLRVAWRGSVIDRLKAEFGRHFSKDSFILSRGLMPQLATNVANCALLDG